MAIVTLSSDIGLRDFAVGAIKGQLLSALPGISITDISHYLSQTNFPQAAYICQAAIGHYPPETIHLILVNCFETPVKYFLLARYRDQWLICPDNGILTMITREKPSTLLQLDCTGAKTLLDITASIISHLPSLLKQSQRLPGKPTQHIVENYPLRPTVGPDWMDGQILFIDQFENVVINITKEEFEEQRRGRTFRFAFNRNEVIDGLSDNFSSVTGTSKLAWFNSAGYLEIAIRHGNIAGLFGLQGYADPNSNGSGTYDSRMLYQTVRVFFD
jgi:S-adenosylmethionine hydrolase